MSSQSLSNGTKKIKHYYSKVTSGIFDWLDKGNRTSVLFLLPYLIMFVIFIILPVFVAIGLSFTQYNSISSPILSGLDNYIFIFTQDPYFMKIILPNTLLFSLIVGPGGYILAFVLAWMLSQLQKKPRTILTLLLYAPSMTAGVAMAVLWKTIFSGDEQGYLNSILLNLNFINEPVQWLQSPKYLMAIMIIVTLWGSMGIGFLAMLSGVLGVNKELYEAAYIDGISSSFQEMWYITIPSMKNQMLFGAVMAIVGAFNAGSIGVDLSGSNPTPQYSGQLIVNHINDYANIRKELGMSAALAVILLIIVYLFSRIFQNLFKERD